MIDFRRFTNVTVCDIPETVKLVLLVGPNGSGKSALFDAMISAEKRQLWGQSLDEIFAIKADSNKNQAQVTPTIVLHNDQKLTKGSIVFRTAFRNDADLHVHTFSRQPSRSEDLRIGHSFQDDKCVAKNYQRLVLNTVQAIYGEGDDSLTRGQIRERLIGTVQASMARVFDDLRLLSLGDLRKDGAFSFAKGSVQAFHYKNLSAGEKSAFDVLLDFVLSIEESGEVVYCIDELDVHLHTRVQGSLTRELYQLLPPSAQLWISAHSLGVMRMAQVLERENPGTVAILDMSDVACDAEEPQFLRPVSVDRVSWNKMLSIVLDDLSETIAPKIAFVCEGTSEGTSRKDFDADILQRVLGSRETDVVFLSGGNCDQVPAVARSVRTAMKGVLPSTQILPLLDRDDMSEDEIGAKRASGVRVLSRWNLEAFLLDDAVIEKLVRQQLGEKPDPEVSDKVRAAKKVCLDALESARRRGKPHDDFKSAKGEVYVGLKQLLGLTRCGSNADAFMRDVLAPLITPDMDVYIELRQCVMGET